MHRKNGFCSSALLTASIVLISCCFVAAAPTINKVEPPNWWVGLQPSPTLLLSGDGLANATVRLSSDYPGVRIGHVQAQPEGKYLFVSLELAKQARPGIVSIQVSAGGSTTKFQFPLLERRDTKDRFKGLSRDDVMYLIMPDRFADGDSTNNMPSGATAGTYDRAQAKGYHGGDLKGIRDRLPYLKEMGITAIWLTPIWANDVQVSDYHGYHPVDFYAVDPHMGTMREYRDMVDEAHRLGIKVFIDYVVNHTGPTHPWGQSAPTATWLHGTPQKHLQPKYDFWPLVDPHSTARDKRNVLEGWFADKLPDLNVDDPLLAQYLLQNAEWWMESSGADGLRLDTFPYSSRKFWSGFHQGFFKAYPNSFTIGEAWNSNPAITSFFQGGRKQWDGIDTGSSTVFDFPFFSTVRDVVLREAPATKLAELFQHDALYPNSELLVTFIGNHDTRRFIGEEGATPEKLKAALSLLMTVRGIPQIYAGDEIAMAGGDDPDNRRDFPGGFRGDQRDAFTTAGRTTQEQGVYSHWIKLVQLRREHPALREGKQWLLSSRPPDSVGAPALSHAESSQFAFARESGNDRVLVVFNNSKESQKIRLDLHDTPMETVRDIVPLLGSTGGKVESGFMEVEVPPLAVEIYAMK